MAIGEVEPAERLAVDEPVKEQADDDAKNAIVDLKLTGLLNEERSKVGVKLNERALEKIDIPPDAPETKGGTGTSPVRKTAPKRGEETPAKSAPEGP